MSQRNCPCSKGVAVAGMDCVLHQWEDAMKLDGIDRILAGVTAAR
jgi:hypothetical protein